MLVLAWLSHGKPSCLVLKERQRRVNHSISCDCVCVVLRYKSASYRARAVREPRSVLQEFGVQLGDNVEVRVHDSTADLRYMVLPQRPAGTEGYDEERLAALVTRDCMVGCGLAREPAQTKL